MNLFKPKSRPKIFCISMQRSGTTSVGRFLEDHGIATAGYPTDERNNWSTSVFEGNLEMVFGSSDFRKFKAFQDSPWWFPGMFKILYHRFPGSKFILLTRDPADWFRSMISHSDGYVLGSHKIHAFTYRREAEYYDLCDRGELDGLDPLPCQRTFSRKDIEKMSLHGHEEHYKSLYELHTRQVLEFFERHNREALFHGSLYDADKWLKIGKFLKIDVEPNYDAHEHKTMR